MKRTSARRRGKHLRRGRSPASRRAAPAAAESRAIARLVICGAVFVLLVAVKLLLPQQMSALARSAGQLVGRDADFRAAFSAVGRAISGEAAVSDSLQEAYTAVFSTGGEVPETAPAAEVRLPDPGAKLMTYNAIRLPLPQTPDQSAAREEVREAPAVPEPAVEEMPIEEDATATETISNVYTMAPLPENASLEQRNLGLPM